MQAICRKNPEIGCSFQTRHPESGYADRLHLLTKGFSLDYFFRTTDMPHRPRIQLAESPVRSSTPMLPLTFASTEAGMPVGNDQFADAICAKAGIRRNSGKRGRPAGRLRIAPARLRGQRISGFEEMKMMNSWMEKTRVKLPFYWVHFAEGLA